MTGMDGTAAAFSMGVIELLADVAGNPMGTVGLVLVSAPETGSGLGATGVGSAGMVLTCIE
jgi:hypothetical protein